MQRIRYAIFATIMIGHLNSCGIAIIPHEKKTFLRKEQWKPLKESMYWRHAYTIKQNCEKEILHIQVQGSTEDLEFTGKEKKEYWNVAKSLKDEKGFYHYKFYYPFSSNERRANSIWEILALDSILAIPSLGSSLVIGTISAIILPFRFNTSNTEKTLKKYEYQRTIQKPLSALTGEIRCGNYRIKLNNGQAEIPLEELFQRNSEWHAIHVCTFFDNQVGEKREFEVRLLHFHDTNHTIDVEANRDQKKVIIDMLQIVRVAKKSLTERFRLNPRGNDFFLNALSDDISFLPAGSLKNELRELVANPLFRYRADWDYSMRIQFHALKGQEKLLSDIEALLTTAL